MKQWWNKPNNVSQNGIEIVYPQKLRQTRKVTNDWLLSQSELKQMFPQLQNVWSNVFINKDAQNTYSIGKEGFTYSSASGRSVRAEARTFNHGGFSILFNKNSERNISTI